MEWINTTVGEFCPFMYGKGLPKLKREHGTIPVYGSNGIVDSHSDSYIKTAGIIIGRKGSCGAVHLSLTPFWPIDTSFYVTKESIDELRFTYFLLNTLGLNEMNSDSAVPGLNRENVHRLEIKIPKLQSDRENIGRLLSTFDKKISNNLTMNETLEKIAQRIFKSWFVDFDPVKANAEGVACGKLSPEIQALFPKEFVESELGLIPKGWEFRSTSGLMKVNGGYAFKSKDFKESGTSVIKIKNISSNKTVEVNEKDFVGEYDREKMKKFELSDGDILMAMTGYVGRCGIFTNLNSPALLNQRVAKITNLQDETCWFLYLSIISDRFLSEVINNGHGSAQPNVSASDILSIKATIPSSDIRDEFNRLISPLFERIIVNQNQSMLLSKIRDKLLPRLISGKITIQKAKEIIDEAA